MVYADVPGFPFLYHVSNNHPGAWSEIGTDPWVKNIVQRDIWSGLWRSHRWRSRAHIPICLRAAEHVSYRFSSTLRKFYSWLFLVTDNRPDNRSLQPQRLHVLPERHYGNTLVNPLGPPEGPVVNIPRYEGHLLSHRNPPSRQMIPSFLSQRHSMAIHSSVNQSLNQPESIYKHTQTSTSLFPYIHGVKLHNMYINEWLLNPGLDTTNVYQMYANSYLKLDTLAGPARSSDKTVTNLRSLTEDSKYISYHLQCIVTL